VEQAAPPHAGPAATHRGEPPRKFSNYTFYLDLGKTKAARVAALEEDIICLGGRLELFFSASVTHLLTDCPEDGLRRAGGGTPGPASPWTPSPTPAPRALTASRTDLLLARATRQPATTGSLPERAARYGINIWTLAKMTAWLDKFKAKFGPLRPRTSRGGLRALISPCIKLEAACRSSAPLFLELAAWPSIRLDGPAGSSPFRPARPVAAAKSRGPVTARRRARPAARPEGFCEICNVSFPLLEEHLATDLHTKFVARPASWAALDGLLALGEGPEGIL
jgi:hypothetical protein